MAEGECDAVCGRLGGETTEAFAVAVVDGPRYATDVLPLPLSLACTVMKSGEVGALIDRW